MLWFLLRPRVERREREREREREERGFLLGFDVFLVFSLQKMMMPRLSMTHLLTLLFLFLGLFGER
jgi:hypothetical protein